MIGFNDGLELGEFFICEAMYGSLVKIHGALLGDPSTQCGNGRVYMYREEEEGDLIRRGWKRVGEVIRELFSYFECWKFTFDAYYYYYYFFSIPHL